jgi:transcriptional regulator with XRE-family HTH domain
MPENPSRINALDWTALVQEALRRRKQEKLTQKEHAALASVSIPTIAAFERGERTLTLEKAFDILRVVGLVADTSPHGAQEVFVQQCLDRWRELTANLPEASPGRMLHGWSRIDYCLEGDLKEMDIREFRVVLQSAVLHHTGWPMFIHLTRPEFAPRAIDGTVECWVPPSDAAIGRWQSDAAHCDFWRALPTGRLFLLRGHEEDGQEKFPPASIFDNTLPMWRIGEGLLHAAKVASLMRKTKSAEVQVHFRALYTGLTGRVLRAWADPRNMVLFEGSAARNDEALLEVTAPAADIERNLGKYVYPLVASLYERFGVTGLSTEWVNAELRKLQASRL